MTEENIFVNDNSEINDIRDPPQFKSITFSGFKKTEVKTQLINSLKNKKIEEACNWAAEFVCAGHFSELWEIFLFYMSKYIHLGNPKMVIYLSKRYDIFKNIIKSGEFLNILQLRNHPTIRQLFAEITSTICLSEKKNSFEAVKLKKDDEFDITQMSEKLIAPNISFVSPIFKSDDPKELFIAANEFAFNISNEKKNMLNACYWIEWCIEFENICKKRKNKCLSEARSFVKVETKFRNDIIWILWDVLIYYSKQHNTFVEQLMNNLFELFCIKYTTASCKKRRYLLYFAVSLCTEDVKTDIDLVKDKMIISNVVKKINSIYKQIKKNEKSPNTEYLFANIDKENAFEKSLKKIELLNTMDIQSRKN
tara:strand:- start:8575 stop:9672 length:1098 start_codon:yes stop_codon:yes gene_type:complete